jgi:hypothetical protein
MRAKTRSIKDLAGILHKEGRETVPLDKLSM